MGDERRCCRMFCTCICLDTLKCRHFRGERVTFQGRAGGTATITPVLATLLLLLLLLINSVR